jgi:hypothetical protein
MSLAPVAPAFVDTWRRLDDSVRDHVHAFLGTTSIASNVIVPAATDLPPEIAVDLAQGGVALRAAFPELVRRVVAIAASNPRRVTIRVTCEGRHCGILFGLVKPTRRIVRFDAVHCLTCDGDRIVEDHLEIDLRAIVRQLAARSRVNATSRAA